MRRLFFGMLVLASVVAFGAGCQNAARIGCEAKGFYFDIQRNIFGIDYPHGQPEMERQPYYGIPAPGRQPICLD